MQIKTTMRHDLTLMRMIIIKKARNNCWWQHGEKRNCWWECKLVQPLCKTVWSFLKKLKIELPYDPAILLLGIYLKKIKALIWKDIYTPMFLVALFIITTIWKQPNYPSTDEWIKKMWYIYIYIYIYIYNGILLSHKKRMKFCHLQQYGWT